MSTHEQLEQLTQRVERLLLRHEEVQRANALLQDELDACNRDRDMSYNHEPYRSANNGAKLRARQPRWR
jgi:hypothetical protein